MNYEKKERCRSIDGMQDPEDCHCDPTQSESKIQKRQRPRAMKSRADR